MMQAIWMGESWFALSIPNTLLMRTAVACDNSGVADDSSLRHVLVVGGSLDQWKLMSASDWSQYISTLRFSTEQVGAQWLTVYPYSGISTTDDDSELMNKISESCGASIVDGKLILRGDTTVVIDVCADGQQRFVRAINEMSDTKISEKNLASAILHPATSEPDLVVIFGDPTHLPPSLVWELAYSELVYLNTQWPHCNSEDIELAINDFQRRDRRFGGVDS
jgi:undecaprenyl diphosphate synthase